MFLTLAQLTFGAGSFSVVGAVLGTVGYHVGASSKYL